MYIDLDDFKQINDNYGHAVGDEALCKVAASLKSIVRTSDAVGRLGGDEFVRTFTA
ncbi:GGDEF domain-containing protein [Pseudoalteromonas sp. B193]